MIDVDPNFAFQIIWGLNGITGPQNTLGSTILFRVFYESLNDLTILTL